MSRILKVCLWLVSSKNIEIIRENSQIVGIDKIMMTPIELSGLIL